MATLIYDIAEPGQLDREIRLDVGAGKPFLDVQILDNGSPVEDLTGATVTFTMTDTNGVKKIDDVAGSVLDGPNAIVRYEWAAADVDTEVGYLGQFKIVTTAPKTYLQPNNATQRLLVFIGRAEAPAINLQPPISLHGGSHILAGLDEVDGDKLGIDFTPANYTPSTAPAEATDLDHLTAHLKGIDDGIGGGGVTDHGALTGLTDDDHDTLYALNDGTRGAFWRTDGGNSPTADMPAGGFKVTGLGGIQINKVVGAAPTSAATQLDSLKAEWQTHLFKTVGGAFIRSGFLRVSPDTLIEDQHQFTFSTTDNGGSEVDFLKIRRNSAGDTCISAGSDSFACALCEAGTFNKVVNVKAGGAWELNTSGGALMMTAKTGFVLCEVGFRVRDNQASRWGNADDAQMEWDTGQTNDALLFGLPGTQGNYLVFTHKARFTLDFSEVAVGVLSAFSNPTWAWHSGGADVTEITTQSQIGVNLVFDALAAAGGIDLQAGGASKIKISTVGIGLFTATPVAQPSSTGQTAGFTAGVGTSVLDDSTFTGGTGTKAYTVGDVVKHLKALGALASS